MKTGYENLVGLHIKDIPTRGDFCQMFANDISLGNMNRMPQFL